MCSPFLCSHLPTSCQPLCLGKGNSPSLASHSHFPLALLCSCKVHLFLFMASPRHSPWPIWALLTSPSKCLPTTIAARLPHWFPCLKCSHSITHHSTLSLDCRHCKMIIASVGTDLLSVSHPYPDDVRPSSLSGWLPGLYPVVRTVSGTKSMLISVC